MKQIIVISSREKASPLFHHLQKTFPDDEIVLLDSAEKLGETSVKRFTPIVLETPREFDLFFLIRQIRLLRQSTPAPILIVTPRKLKRRIQQQYLDAGADSIISQRNIQLLIHQLQTLFRLTEQEPARPTNLLKDQDFRIFFEHIPDYTLLMEVTADRGPIIIDASESACRKHGYTRQEFIGMPVSKLDAPEARAKIPQRAKQLFQEGSIFFQTRHLRKDGTTFPVEVYAVLIELNGKKLIFSVERDISEKLAARKALDESEERFFLMVENSPAGILLLDAQGRIIYSNKRFTEISGYPTIDLLHRDFLEILGHPHAPLSSPSTSKKEGKNLIPQLSEFQITTRSGDVRILEMRSAVIRTSGGKENTILQLLDVTEQRKLEQEIFKERELIHALMNNTPDMIYFKDAQSRFTRINKAFAEALGLSSPEEAVGRTVKDFFEPEQANELMGDDHHIIRNKQPVIGRIDFVKFPSGKTAWVSSTKAPILDKNQNVIGLVGISRDITDQIEMREALRQSEEMYRGLIEQSNDAIYLLYEEKFVMINKRFTEMFGYTPEEVRAPGFNFMALVSPKSYPIIEARIRKYQMGEELDSIYEFTALTKDNREIEVEVSVSYVKYKEGVATQGIIRDISERKKAETQLMRLAQVIEQASEAVIITDISGSIEYVNPAFEKITGYRFEEVLGQNPRILKSGKHDEAFYQNLWDTITSGAVWRGKFINKKKDGSLYYEEAAIFPITDDKGKIINFAAVKHDITSQHLLEEQFQQAQKMEAVGKLAGGIAHDFNNLLTVINGYCDLLLYRIKPGEPFYNEISQIQKAGERAAALTSQLLAFSRKQLIQPKILNINQVVHNTEKMFKRIIGEDIQVVLHLKPDVHNIKIDPGQLDQVIMNLIVNARDAMPNGGILTIETDNVVIDQSFVQTHLGATPGLYVRLTISDTGIGMDEETQSHIFEPFFTTKGRDKGTGLGLSTVYGIVKQNNGYILVESAPGEGTTFRIYFPAETREETASESHVQATFKGNGETILLIEDEEEVRALAQKILSENNYQVLLASDGESALKIIEEYSRTIHLVLTDVVMPGRSGPEVARAIQEKRPGTKVVYMSGYTDDSILPHGILAENTRLIQKPFGSLELLRTIREALEESDS